MHAMLSGQLLLASSAAALYQPMQRHQPASSQQQPIQRHQPSVQQQPPLQQPLSREPLHRRLLQGRSLRTWSGGPYQDQADVSIGTNGRPLDAEVELWEGPGNTPVRTRVWSEDGDARPFRGMVHTRGPHSVAIRNNGPLEFPAAADVVGDAGPTRPRLGTQYDGRGLSYQSLVVGDSSTTSDRIQGGALRTFRVHASVESVEVRLHSEGMPVYGAIEVLQGPNTEKQVIELYTENGRDRPISYILETPGYGCVISISNTWPSMEYPLNAYVLPHFVNQHGYGYDRYGEQRYDGYDGVGYGSYGDGFGGVGHGGYDPRASRGRVVPTVRDPRRSAPATTPPPFASGGVRGGYPYR